VREMAAQAEQAIAESDVIMFVVDARDGITAQDQRIAQRLRIAGRRIVLTVNKAEGLAAGAWAEFHELGLGEPYAVSAAHGDGVAALLDVVLDGHGADEVADDDDGSGRIRVAIVGRPNVGKSTLINRLLGFERSVVDSTPGTTRDSLDTPFNLLGEPCILIDTAGIRRKARIDDRIERFSVSHALRVVERGDLIIHVIDGPEGVTDQDAQLLSFAVQRGKALVLAVNKWDIVSNAGGEVEKYREEVNYRLSFLEFVPVTFISAATGYGVRKLLETEMRVVKN